LKLSGAWELDLIRTSFRDDTVDSGFLVLFWGATACDFERAYLQGRGFVLIARCSFVLLISIATEVFALPRLETKAVRFGFSSYGSQDYFWSLGPVVRWNENWDSQLVTGQYVVPRGSAVFFGTECPWYFIRGTAVSAFVAPSLRFLFARNKSIFFEGAAENVPFFALAFGFRYSTDSAGINLQIFRGGFLDSTQQNGDLGLGLNLESSL
jgi:hypothetical protein